MQRRLGWLLAFLFMALLAFAFMYRTWLFGQVPFPGDLLTGAYAPWATTSHPIKNPLVSDVFSQVFPWKALIANQLRQGRLPLWNPYTLSGYPLLANYHSGALYPGNLLLLGDFISGWNWLLWLQLFGCAASMFIYLRVLRYRFSSSLIGSITYAFSGFALVMWQLAHAGQAMIWVPLTLAAIEKKKYFFLPAGVFLLATAGHFQALVYGLTLFALYSFWKYRRQKTTLVSSFAALTLGLGLSALLLLPAFEMSRLSVRSTEQYISEENYGLLPPSSLATLVAPDFFGHPATRNYWATFNYQERTIYVGLWGCLSLAISLVLTKNLSQHERFWQAVTFIALLLLLATGPGRLIYDLRLPWLSTSSASRLSLIVALGASLLSAAAVTHLPSLTLPQISTALVLVVAIAALGFLHPDWPSHLPVITHNLILPGALASALTIILLLRRFHLSRLLLLTLVVADLFRFGWKYQPFSPRATVFPSTQLTQFLTSQPGPFKVERLDAAILPPNTWEYYGLTSSSGYDPLAPAAYTQAYHRYLNDRPHASGSRYTVLDTYLPKPLADYGVKYLLSPQDSLVNSQLKTLGWRSIWAGEGTTVWENPHFSGLAQLSSPGQVQIGQLQSGRIDLRATVDRPTQLTLLTGSAPGWQARINGHPSPISSTPQSFLTLTLPPGSSTIKLRYFPLSLVLGFGITATSLSLYLYILLFKHFHAKL